VPNGDGIGDAPYSIDSDNDNYPLMKRWEKYFRGNKPPITTFTITPSPANQTTVIFNASLSYDPDDYITLYEWDFGDGTVGTGKVAIHSYSSAGNYTVVLTVTDADGATNSTSKMVTIPLIPTIIYVPDEYAKIQWAIENATEGDIIIIRDGAYIENVDVNKRLTIQSENGSSLVRAAEQNDHVFEITADYVNIIGFTVEGATEWSAGIYTRADYCNISDNNCSNNEYGIYLFNSRNNQLKSNIMVNNGIVIWGNSITNFMHEIDESNTVNEKPVYYWKNVEGDKIPEGGGQVILVNCTNISVERQNINFASVSIEVAFSSYITIENNNCSNSWRGISLKYSNNSSIFNNNCSNNFYGIYLDYSNNSSISNNKCCLNNWSGIYLDYSNNNRISNNNCCSNKWDGIDLSSSNSNIISNNNCSNNERGILLSDSENNRIFNNSCSKNRDGIQFFSSNSNIISNNNCSNNVDGIYLKWCSSNNSISNNNCSNNAYGIEFTDSNNNRISSNNYSNNAYGIFLKESKNNIIYLNSFIKNSYNVYSRESTNVWNSTSKIIYTYEGTTYENYLGNYWDDYTGSDADNDGIGDTLYTIDSNKDNYPLMGPWENYFAPTENIFDTEAPANPYPSIMGTHKGEIKPSDNINVSKLYTYPCPGTGGHTESIKLYENGELIASGIWNGYQSDYHNITITPSVTLLTGNTYNYTIVTGSYPQIIHEPFKEVTGGTITCTSFVDANGKTYTDWIPAIRLE